MAEWTKEEWSFDDWAHEHPLESSLAGGIIPFGEDEKTDCDGCGKVYDDKMEKVRVKETTFKVCSLCRAWTENKEDFIKKIFRDWEAMPYPAKTILYEHLSQGRYQSLKNLLCPDHTSEDFLLYVNMWIYRAIFKPEFLKVIEPKKQVAIKR